MHLRTHPHNTMGGIMLRSSSGATSGDLRIQVPKLHPNSSDQIWTSDKKTVQESIKIVDERNLQIHVRTIKVHKCIRNVMKKYVQSLQEKQENSRSPDRA